MTRNPAAGAPAPEPPSSSPQAVSEPARDQAPLLDVEAPLLPDPGDPSGRDRIAKNVLWIWAGYFVEIVTGFVLPRLMDRQIGQTALGVWDLAWSCTAYFRVAQIGIGGASSRYLARYWGLRDVEGLRRVASSTVGLSAGIALLVLTMTAVVTGSLPFMVGSRLGDETATAQWVLAVLGAGLAFNYLCEVFSSVLTGSHRWDVQTALSSGSQLLISIAMIVTLSLGGGLREIALAHTGGIVIGELVRMAVAYRIFPELKIRPAYWSPELAKGMLTFGAKGSVGMMASLILSQTNKLLVASHLGPAALALYARPNALVRVPNLVVAKMAVVFQPVTSSLQGAGRRDEIAELTLKGTRAATALVVPMSLGLVILGGPILRLWMGANYEQGMVLTLLVLAAAPRLCLQPAMNVLAGLNLVGYIAKATWVAAVIGVALSFLNIVILDYGLVGAAAAVAISMLAMNELVALYVCRRVGIQPAKLVREAFLPPLACGVPFAAVLVASRIAFGEHPALALGCGVLAGSLVLAPLYWRFLMPDQLRGMVLRRAPATLARHLRAFGPRSRGSHSTSSLTR